MPDRSNLDAAAEAHNGLPALRAKRDRHIYLASREDGASYEKIARQLGLTRQAVANVVHRLDSSPDRRPLAPRYMAPPAGTDRGDIQGGLREDIESTATGRRSATTKLIGSFDPDEDR